MTMREKIARALFDRHWSALPEGSRPAWPGDDGGDYWEWLADAVLDALMDPDEGMREAGKAAFLYGARRDPASDFSVACGDIFTAMLTAARSGG
jgi:hypothetical protein